MELSWTEKCQVQSTDLKRTGRDTFWSLMKPQKRILERIKSSPTAENRRQSWRLKVPFYCFRRFLWIHENLKNYTALSSFMSHTGYFKCCAFCSPWNNHNYRCTVKSNSSRSSKSLLVSWCVKFADKYRCSIRTTSHVSTWWCFSFWQAWNAVNWSLLMSGLILVHEVLVAVVHPAGGHACLLLHLQKLMADFSHTLHKSARLTCCIFAS